MSKFKILVVEDDPDVRLGYHILLKAHQYDTCFATDGLSAISEARKQQPDLILLDLGLPAGDGYVVLGRIRAHMAMALIPVVVVSARDASSHRERVLAAGASAYVQKPWDDAELLETIRRLLNPGE